ncbi:efflux transporter outer membrane subunit [Entomobacter blattae]|uniref:Outer membrane protein OprM n=1 Tax=Entomobacter blattae TaxID=2762277 RepID=A0A7H1NRI2_9PROT|nr:efflux transporter outer membrane subunit [Entomobacter blattae]QNT78392.1 Outer membrane protein OprM [Entomobacter blattae]
MTYFFRTRKYSAALSATLLLFTTQCDLAPDYRQPDLPTAEVYPRNTPLDTQLPAISTIAWQDFFPDAQLRGLITQALANNRDLKIATSRVEEARHYATVQGASLYPQINANAIGGKFHTPGLSRYDGANSTLTFYSGSIGANWEIDFWGRIRNMEESAFQQFLGSMEGQRAVATSLVAQVARTYLADRAYNDQIAIAEQTIETRKESYRIVKRRYEVGSGGKLDVTQSYALLAEARQQFHQLQQLREQNLNALTLLVGKPVSLPAGSLSFSDLYLSQPLPAGLPSDLVLNRPDIIQAEYALRAVDADIGAARAAFLPRVMITAAGGTSSSEFNALFGGDSATWNFMPVISMPLFNGLRNLGNLKLAEARRNTAVAEYEKAIQTAFRDVADAMAARHWLTSRIEETKHQIAALQERTRLAQLRYVSGYSAYLEVLEAQRDQFNTEQALVQLHQAYLTSAVDLYTALGGGFPKAHTIHTEQDDETTDKPHPTKTPQLPPAKRSING